ncbi:hypothetical protein IWX85_003945 [Polaromonas sp. CG_9.11]|nr:hypothetical protein [Polaromonas sp. CG_9.11]
MTSHDEPCTAYQALLSGGAAGQLLEFFFLRGRRSEGQVQGIHGF